MGLKKKSKVSAEFSMSSLTDIIFLLLIFFMLTSSLVSPNALNIKFPGQSDKQESTDKEVSQIRINDKGKFTYNGIRVSRKSLEASLRKLQKRNNRKTSINIYTNPNAPVGSVAYVMDAARRYRLDAIMLSEK